MPHAMHCITNHDIWSRMRDLASQLLFPLSLISALVSTVMCLKGAAAIVSDRLKTTGSER